ncbi:unnamed protein product [Sphagnum balticum]
MLGLAVQPPAQARPGSPLYPPLAARLSSEMNIFDQLSNTWAVATLVHQSGKILDDQLGGRVADSAHPLPEIGSGHHRSRSSEKDRAYFYFPNLTIYEPGRYRIRVSLMQMDYSCDTSPDGIVRVCEYIDSRSIVVEDRAENSGRPSKITPTLLR